MNRVVVGQAAAGLATYLIDSGLAGGRVIIGYDARHNSDRFALDTAEIMAGAGFEAMITSGPLPTPVVAFGIRHFGCVAGVVVTASHNPPQDNGYKVYLGDGSQIVPPADAEIAARIDEVAGHDLAEVPRSTAYTTLGDELVEAYLDRVAALVPPDGAARAELGLHPAARRRAGRSSTGPWPRGGFPAVPGGRRAGRARPAVPDRRASPIPRSRARSTWPGAGRASRTPTSWSPTTPTPTAARWPRWSRAGWRMLSGDELGALLGDDALRSGRRGTYACSIVSSSLLAAMAAAHGQPFAYTLTGFKWIGRVPGLAFGYEEAIGYCVDPEAVPDKDGISALLRVLAAGRRAEGGRSDRGRPAGRDRRTYGVFGTDQLSVRVADLSLIAAAMARLRARPPGELDRRAGQVTDLADGTDDLPPTDAVLLTGPSLKVVVRPSGTEPKLKCYLEVRQCPPPGALARAAGRGPRRSAGALRAEMAAVLGLSADFLLGRRRHSRDIASVGCQVSASDLLSLGQHDPQYLFVRRSTVAEHIPAFHPPRCTKCSAGTY